MRIQWTEIRKLQKQFTAIIFSLVQRTLYDIKIHRIGFKLVNSESRKTNESHFVIKSKKLKQKFSLLLMETCENNTNINVFKITSATSKEGFKYSTSCYRYR